jgi:large subunit ribosomal protein L6
MSRVGKQPIIVPKGVKTEILGQSIKVQGPKGTLQRNIRPEIKLELVEDSLVLTRRDEVQTTIAYHGLERALVNNMVVGVSEGFVKELELIGVGYKADLVGKNLDLGLGYSHPIQFPVPEGLKAEVIKEGRQIFIKLEGADRQLVGQVAAKLRSLRAPEPYKGKGVRYKGEVVKIKADKAGKK